MATYAFTDTNVGLLQGIENADTFEDAVKQHAANVGLIEEISLDMHYAEVSEAEASALMEWSAAPRASEFPENIRWRTVDDETIRSILGFGPRHRDPLTCGYHY